ncbi:MAG: hypothetical protein KatS3mg035_0181 [Bacteroidia bacterium]|nr:MAG: hypothetical protein KatS3mg035_0181 [Bacteroidia bacterium]
MLNQDFLKKIYDLKLHYQKVSWDTPLQLQTILRKNIKDWEMAIGVSEFIINEKKFKHKFPKLIEGGGLIKSLVAEQATDEQVAEHKASFFQGNHFLDLTAGLAIDTMAFAKNFSKLIAIEANPDLIPLLQWNANKLGFQNIEFVYDTAENFLSYNTSLFDLVYLDPSRKIQQKKVYHPKDYSPNIFEILPSLNRITKKVLIKLSPMIEVQELSKWFQNIEWIWLISKNRECKEILVLINTEYNTKPQYRLSILNKQHVYVYELDPMSIKKENKEFRLVEYSWVLIPDVVFVKSHALFYLQNVTQGFLTDAQDGVLLLSQKTQNDYGKLKKIVQVLSLKDFEKYQKKYNLWKAQVIKKHFSLKVEEIRKKWKILEGNSDTLIFVKIANQSYVIHGVED